MLGPNFMKRKGSAGHVRSLALQLPESAYSRRTINSIRGIIESEELQTIVQNPPTDETRQLISLSIGDPTVFGNLPKPQFLIDEIVKVSQNQANHGYFPSNGSKALRDAVSAMYSYPFVNMVNANDVVITCGCSHGLEIIFKALCSIQNQESKSNSSAVDLADVSISLVAHAHNKRKVLIPRPGFPLYQTLLVGYNLDFDYYDLDPETWCVDLNKLALQLESDMSVVAILVNNPSNPCGTVFPREHLIDILQLCKKRNLIVLADEIYGDLTFRDQKFYPMAALASEVPIITLSGISKELLVPGFRLGWIIFHEGKKQASISTGITQYLANVKKGSLKLSQLISGANSLVQAATANVLVNNQDQLFAFKHDVAEMIAENVLFICNRFNSPYFKEFFSLVEPHGSMYALIKLNENKFGQNASRKFMLELVKTQRVMVLPGEVFNIENYIRITTTAPKQVLAEAFDRIEVFVKNISRSSNQPLGI